ncbi:MAG: hypothetical protein K2O89_05655 [Clostridia bacterium]|nr:hypothetical protein [Clostridia bacterium]
MERCAFLGPCGSYSHLAAIKMRPKSELLPCGNFHAVMSAVVTGECDFAVIPIENTLNGGVLQNIDLLQSVEGVVAVEEMTLPLDHRLATLNGAKYSGISRIYSHEQPLAQCRDYLLENFPDAQLMATSSTAASLDMVKTFSDAAIVGAHVKREGIVLSNENIADGKNNFTHFLLVRRGCIEENKQSSKIYFSVTCAHRSGALLDILEPMRAGGLNMTKIQSRPIKDRAGEYRFFIEAEGDYSKISVRKVLEGVKNSAKSYKLLGAY